MYVITNDTDISSCDTAFPTSSTPYNIETISIIFMKQYKRFSKLSINISENTGKFLLRDLAALTKPLNMEL